MRFIPLSILMLLTAAGLSQAQAPGVLPVSTLPPDGGQNLGQPTAPELQQMFAPASGPANAIWFRSDYVLWWVKSAPNSTPLVTTSPFDPNAFVPGVSPAPGTLNNPNTTTLFGAAASSPDHFG